MQGGSANHNVGRSGAHPPWPFCDQLTESVKRSKEDRLVLLTLPTAACSSFVDEPNTVKLAVLLCLPFDAGQGELTVMVSSIRRKFEVVGGRCEKMIGIACT